MLKPRLLAEISKSKFDAECEIRNAILDKGLKAKIIRVGNLMSRSSDGEFQINFRKIYDVYSDVVAKNPNYELDMPIRVNTFDEAVNKIFGA